MGKALVIAEKPSVAGDLARVLGKFKKDKDFYENEDYVISSAIGHLVEIIPPEDQEVKRGKWNIENLPVIPTHFDLRPIAKTEPRFKLLKRLAKRKDVDLIINACDAGREGELIFRYIVQLAAAKKPYKRLWLQSMTPTAIRENFAGLREDAEMLPLADAAMCRSEADWLVGINGTRALTSFNSQGGGFRKTTVGRVQTPTLAILVSREEEIRQFVSTPYWEVHAVFSAEKGEYAGRWIREGFKKSDERPHDRAERIWDKESAETIARECFEKDGIVEETSRPSTQAHPLLYDLTSLQREANSRFGFPARMTLSLAQALYEKHKVLTYPRTDSRHLPDDYEQSVKQALQVQSDSPLAPLARKVLSNNWVRTADRRVFNQEKVSDHHAIIPTSQLPKKLTEAEEKLYDMVVRRFLAVFYPVAEFEITTRITRVESHAFKTEGKVLKVPGWYEVYQFGRTDIQQKDEEEGITPVTSGEKVHAAEVEVRESATRPPARYSEATLLSAMEGAGKLVDDEELREAMGAKGLGTPATRASIIENLISEVYINRDGRELIPTPKAFDLIETLRAIQIKSLGSAELTGEWEHKLKLIEQGQLSRADFMGEIQDITRRIVEKIRKFDPEQATTRKTDLVDPFSGQPMIETLRDYRTPDGSFILRKAYAGRVMELSEFRELLEKRTIGPLEGFRNRMGRPFSALMKLRDDHEVELDWGGSDRTAEFTPEQIAAMECVGKCPKDGARVLVTDTAYICENAFGKEKKCDFRFSRTILSQEVSPEQARKILNEGKSDLLTGFVSQRTKRPFKAFLIVDKGKVGFEFPPREPKNLSQNR